jgi:LysM repeat protein
LQSFTDAEEVVALPTSTLPSGTIGVDYSFARPDPKALHAAGARFASRYLARVPNQKVIDRAERDRLWEAGLGILLNWEERASDWRTPANGDRHGARAAQQAFELGYPMTMPILVSVDTDAEPSEIPRAREYFERFTAAAAGYPIGGYTAAPIANELVDRGLTSFVWGPAARSWNRGKKYKRLDMQQDLNPTSKFPGFQKFGKQIDVNKATSEIVVWTATAGTAPTRGFAPSRGTAPNGTEPTAGTYTVESGDSWFGIAAKLLGSGSRMHELAAANGKSISDPIRPGDVLKVPPGVASTPSAYTVQKGDSWFGIAAKLLGSGARMRELAAANGKSISDQIHPGQVLLVPPR